MKTFLFLLVTCFATAAFGIEDTPANREAAAKRYLAAVPVKSLFNDLGEQMARTAPPDQREMILKVFTQYIDADAMTKCMLEVMVRHFTADELQAMAQFYGSDVGKSVMKKFGAYMADAMPFIQAEMMKVDARVRAELQKNK